MKIYMGIAHGILFSIINMLLLLPPITTAHAEEIAAHNNNMNIVADFQNCSSPIKIKAYADHAAEFQNDKRNLQMLLGSLQIPLKEKCATLPDFHISGYYRQERVYQGTMSPTQNWLLTEGIKTPTPTPVPQLKPEPSVAPIEEAAPTTIKQPKPLEIQTPEISSTVQAAPKYSIQEAPIQEITNDNQNTSALSTPIVPTATTNNSADQILAAEDKIKTQSFCSDQKQEYGNWYCNGHILVNTAIGSYPIETNITKEYATKVTFLIKNDLVRNTSYPLTIKLASLIDPAIATALSSEDNKRDYLRGRREFNIGEYTVSINALNYRYALEIEPKKKYSYEDFSCHNKLGLKNWDIDWRTKTVTALKPDLIQSNPLSQITGAFIITPTGINPAFNLWGNTTSDYNVTILADQKTIYQGKWVTKKEPTCCTTSLNKQLSMQDFKSMASAQQATIILSRDDGTPEAQASFFPQDINKILNTAETSKTDAGVCTIGS